MYKSPVDGDKQNNMERYRSGHNEAVLKTVCPKGARVRIPLSPLTFTHMKVQALDTGEVPKRLKGLPWKGSRPLIAARGFKSLLLR